MDFNVNALNAFRNVNLGGGSAIANLSEGGKVEQKGSYHGALGAIFRSATTKAANNAVRTELLRSLGNAFGLSGMSEAGGKVVFSKDFMDRLSDLLGPAFKREDFGVGADGTVSSGKPLTQRRISAIVKQAKIVGQTGYDYDVFRAKLDHAKEVAAKLPDGGGRLADALKTADTILEILHDDADAMVADNPEYDLDYAEIDPSPRFTCKYVVKFRDENGNPQKELFDDKLPFDQVGGKLQTMIGAPVHIAENILGNGKIAKPTDLTDPKGQINAYVKKALTNYLGTLLGTFAAAEKAGKTAEFARSIGYEICLEARTNAIATYRLNKLPLEDAGPAAAPGNAPVAAPVAVPVATHNKDQVLNQCMGREITALMTADPSIERWDQVADRVKANLVGSIRPIDVPVKTGEIEDEFGDKVTTYKFEPLLDNEGKPVVREITAEDIDKLGEAVMSTIFNG